MADNAPPVVSAASVKASGISCTCGQCHVNSIPGGSLDANEAKGHTLLNHVLAEPPAKKTQLDERLEREKHLKAASTYDDKKQAEHAVNSALKDNDKELAEWLASDTKEPLVLHGELNGGQVRVKGAKGNVFTRRGNTAVVVLRKDKSSAGFFVLTSYPQST